MGYILSKTLLTLILPPAGLIIVMLAGFLVSGCCRCFGRFLAALGLIGLYCLSISPVSDALLRPLESAFPPLKDSRVKAEAIVVLGGGARDTAWAGLPVSATAESETRLVAGVLLYRSQRLPLVLTGGRGDPSGFGPGDADAMERLAAALGVPKKNIIAERTSRNTLESARAVRSLIRAKRIILVTSAYHMKRAAALFRKQGFDVIAAPALYLSEQRKPTAHSFIPRADTLAASSAACAEYASLIWYSLNNDL